MEDLLDNATDPNNISDNIDESVRFADHLKSNHESYGIALKRICLKIRTWNPAIAHQALNVLETCLERCGPMLAYEVGKNVFLNELIKIVHSHYDGSNCPLEVRLRIVRLLKEWSVKYKHLPKIGRAYELLVQNGVISELGIDDVGKDGASSVSLSLHPCVGDTRSNRKLSELVKKPSAENVWTANQLIKNMLHKEEQRLSQQLAQSMKLDQIQEHCRLMQEVMNMNKSPTDDDKALLQELNQVCQSHLDDMARDCDIAAANNDPLLEKMLQTADFISTVIEKYNYYMSEPHLPKQPEVVDDLLISFESTFEPEKLVESDLDPFAKSNDHNTPAQSTAIQTSNLLEQSPITNVAPLLPSNLSLLDIEDFFEHSGTEPRRSV